MDLANEFNNHYCNVANSLKLKPDLNEAIQLMNKYIQLNHKSLYLDPTSEVEIYGIVKRLKNKSSTGWDGIPINLVKQSINSIKPHLTFIFNLCLTHGVFPDSLKISIIKPIIKVKNVNRIDNFRPISILPCLSKILEKLIHSRMSSFIYKFNLINEEQFGFCHGKSTLDAISRLMNSIFIPL